MGSSLTLGPDVLPEFLPIIELVKRSLFTNISFSAFKFTSSAGLSVLEARPAGAVGGIKLNLNVVGSSSFLSLIFRFDRHPSNVSFRFEAEVATPAVYLRFAFKTTGGDELSFVASA